MTAITVTRWRCQPDVERRVALFLSDFVPTPITRVPREDVTAIFEAHSPMAPDLREAAWVSCWGAEFETETIDEEDVEYILINQQWMSDTWACRVLGGCALDAQLCQELRFRGSPGWQPEPD